MAKPLITQILTEVTLLPVDITKRRDQEVPDWMRALDDEKKLCVAKTFETKGDIERKFKKNINAVVFYSEAIKACGNCELKCTLLGKRMEAEFELGDFSGALEDAVASLAINPDRLPICWYAAESAYKTRMFAASAKFCANLINAITDQSDESLLLIREQAKRLEVKAYSGLETLKRLCEELKSRAINFAPIKEGECLTEEILRPAVFRLENSVVRFDEDDNRFLQWPAVLVFADLGFHLSVKCINDSDVLADFLDQQLPTHLPRDVPLRELFIKSANLAIYSKNIKADYFFKINAKSTIKKIVEDNRFFVVNGVLLFLIGLQGCPGFEKKLKQLKRIRTE